MGRVVSTTERDIIRYYYYFVQQTERGFAFLRCESSSYDTARLRRGDDRLAWGKSSGTRTGGSGGGRRRRVSDARGDLRSHRAVVVVVVVIGAAAAVVVVIMVVVIVQQPQTQTA